MSHRLDPVSVAIDDEGGVVMCVVLGPEARLAVVAASGCERRRVECIDGGTSGRAEADMPIERRAVGAMGDPKRERLLPQGMRIAAAVAGRVLDVEHASIAERRQHRVIEGAAPREVAYAEREMVDH